MLRLLSQAKVADARPSHDLGLRSIAPVERRFSEIGREAYEQRDEMGPRRKRTAIHHVAPHLLDADGRASFAVLRGFPTDFSFRFHGGSRTTVVPVSAVILSELLIHDRDLADAVDADWVIPPAEATLVLRGVAEPGPDGYPPLLTGWLAPGAEPLLAASLASDDPVSVLTAVFHRTEPATPELAQLVSHLRPV